MQPTSNTSSINDIAFRILADHTDQVVFVKDINGRFTFINEAGKRLFGLNLSEIIGKTETDLLGPSIGFESWETDHKIILSEQTLTSEVTWKIKDNVHRFKSIKQPITNDQNGEIIGIINLFENLPPKQQEEMSKPAIVKHFEKLTSPKIPPNNSNNSNNHKPNKISVGNELKNHSSLSRALLSLQSAMVAVSSSLDLKHICDTLTWELINLFSSERCSVFIIDQKNRTVHLQATYQDQSAMPINEAYEMDEFPLFRQVVDECRPLQYQLELLEPTLSEYHLMKSLDIQTLLTVPMVHQEQVIGLVNLGESATSRLFTDWEISLALLLANQTASSIVNAQLYSELGVANNALTASNEELDAFAHTVSHDLKSPLARMLGFSEFIIQDIERISPADLKDFLNIIARNSRKMNNIINGLLTLSTVRQEEVENEIIDMMGYLTEAVNRLLFQFDDIEIELEIPDSLPNAWGYGPWIEEVWINYLSNAVKYGGQPVRIKVGALVQDNDMIRYWVKDNGKGLTPEQQKQLFIPFARLNQVTIEGHGLGLSIVQRIVRKLGGDVGIESELDLGSIFYFTLPSIT